MVRSSFAVRLHSAGAIVARAATVAVMLLWPSALFGQTWQVVEYYDTDAVGSIRVVTDAAGAVVARQDFLPFGEELNPQTPPHDKRLFTGQERDFETGQDYFGARYYRAKLGRFTTIDPDHASATPDDPQSWNAYAYARNNPLRFMDPDGREYQICAYGRSCGRVSDQYFSQLEQNPGAGITLRNGWIFATVNGQQVVAGTYEQTSVDPTFNSFIRQTGDLADRWLSENAKEMAIGSALSAVGGAVSGMLSGGLATESVSVTGGLGSLKYGKAAGKLARQMAARGWTDDMIRQAIISGQKIQTINKATGNLAIRYVHPGTGQSIVIDTVTKEIIHVGGPGFRY